MLALAEKARVLRIDDQEWDQRVQTARRSVYDGECAKSDCSQRAKLSRRLRGWQSMGVTRNQFLKTQGANWRQRHDEDDEHPNGS